MYSTVNFFITIAGGQPDCALSENKAYSLQPSPAYEHYDDDEYINTMRPSFEKGTHVS